MKNAVILLLALFIGKTQAATIEVDGTVCGLRDAISAATTDSIVGGCSAGEAGEDTLNLAPESIFSLTTSNPPPIDRFGLVIRFTDIIIEGNGSTIERADNAPEFGILLIETAHVTINNLTVRNGKNLINTGGGIAAVSNSTKIILNHVNVVDNIGGGVNLSSSISSILTHEINNSRIANNSIISSTNDDYSIAAGLTVGATSVVVKNTTIDGNVNDSSGGGVLVSYGGLLMINSTVSGNSSGDSGGGIAVRSWSNVVNIFGSTISNNYSSNIGGGINFNSSGSATTNPNNYLRIYSSIIAGNFADIAADEINGTVDQSVQLNGYNIIGTYSVSGSENILLGSRDLVATESIEQILLPLNDELHYQKVHGLFATSPAIDYAPNPCVEDHDQIGNPRPLDGNNDNIFSCDTGAIEHVFDAIYMNGFE